MEFRDGFAPVLCDALDIDLIEWHGVSYLGWMWLAIGKVLHATPRAVAFLSPRLQGVHQTFGPIRRRNFYREYGRSTPPFPLREATPAPGLSFRT
jgi:hypothetical protein